MVLAYMFMMNEMKQHEVCISSSGKMWKLNVYQILDKLSITRALEPGNVVCYIRYFVI